MNGKLAKLMMVAMLAVTLPRCVPQLVTNSRDHQNYSDYVASTQQMNGKREKAGLPPDPIMTFDQWKGSE